MLETISRQSMGIYPNQFISRSNLSSTRSGLGECLTDKPRSPPEKLKYPNMLPGAMYDAEAQCHMEFPGSKVCQQSSVKFSRISRTAGSRVAIEPRESRGSMSASNRSTRDRRLARIAPVDQPEMRGSLY